ncbi:hypothetical protein PV10_05869 [Exophiala mesophila]|uniref:Pentatricopeptide repeat protein n=1 Tax=Exophiala mesophila TaxID=212818 RepID=A0A0D1ZWX0_EXOME|nr:uncharacterized protein PV10_05869 [Exophiala mesophila]KIV91318.1 hypothetical protein PV10_05869 [Exophiala mesophila]
MFVRSIGAVKSCLRHSFRSNSSNSLYPFLGRASSSSLPRSAPPNGLGQLASCRPRRIKPETSEQNATATTSDGIGPPKASGANEHGLDPDQGVSGFESSPPSSLSSVCERAVNELPGAAGSLPDNETQNPSAKAIQISNMSDDPASDLTETWGTYWAYVHVLWRTAFRDICWPVNDDYAQARRNHNKQRLEADEFIKNERPPQLSTEDMKEKFIPLLIGGLLHSPKATLIIMRAMHHLLEYCWKIRCDCLIYLRRFHWEEIDENESLKREFERQVELASRHEHWSVFEIPPACLHLFLNYSSPERCEYVLKRVHAMYEPLLIPVIKVMVDYYLKIKDADRAMDLISRLSTDQLQSRTGEDFEPRFVWLIRMDRVSHTETGMNFEFLSKLVKLGVTITPWLHNEVLERAVELRLPDVYWEMFRYMSDNNIEIDARRHLVLLRHCFDNRAVDDVNTIMTSIYERPDIRKNPLLVAYSMKMVGAVCSSHLRLSPEGSVQRMLAIYDQAFDRGPLVKVKLAEPLSKEDLPDELLPFPSAIQFGFILWACILVQRRDKAVDNIWRLFLHFVHSGDHYWCELGAHTVLYDAFVIYYSRNPMTIHKAEMVLETQYQMKLCKPKEITYKLMVSGYLLHGQDAQAQALGQTMMKRGVKPTLEGWDFVLKNYGESRFVARLLATLEGIPAPEGFQEKQHEHLSDEFAKWEPGAMPQTP